MKNNYQDNSQENNATRANEKQVGYANEFGIWVSEEYYKKIRNLLEPEAPTEIDAISIEPEKQVPEEQLSEIASYVKTKKSLSIILKYIYHLGSNNLLRNKYFKDKSFMQILKMYEEKKVDCKELMEALKECMETLKRFEN